MLASLFRAALERILRAGGAPAAIVAALSGGMDSVVLAHLLSRSRDALPGGAGLVLAHLNHGLRPGAAADQAFCRECALRLGVPLAERAVDVAALARAERIGVEEAGRVARYRFFRELGGAGALVLTGHHADDQAETILLNLRRGAHRRGLSGMRESAAVPAPPGPPVRVGRPLLAAGRGELRRYALAHGLEWREDETNADNAYARNRIRNKILPALERLLPGFRGRLLERAARTAGEEDALSRAGAALAESLTRREAGGRFFRIAGEPASPELMDYALRHAVEEETGARLPGGAVLRSLSALAARGRTGETLSLAGRLRVRREPDGLFFFFPDRGEPAARAETVLPDPPFRIAARGLEITAEWREADGRPPPEDMADPRVEWLNPEAVLWPLRLRAPLAGERFRPLGAPGSRKIQDILVDAKLPRRKRGLPRVIADGAGALWLWPLRLAQRARVPEEGAGPRRALRLCVRGLPEGDF